MKSGEAGWNIGLEGEGGRFISFYVSKVVKVKNYVIIVQIV